jgi:hypothetical protein
MDEIVWKLDRHASSSPSGMPNGHVRIWLGAFAPMSAETTIENLEKLISDMANFVIFTIEGVGT